VDRSLTFAQRYLKAPLGLAYLLVLALLAIPVMIYMSALYYLVAGVKALLPSGRKGRRGGRDAGGEVEERVA
jgi:hypothetical protein